MQRSHRVPRTLKVTERVMKLLKWIAAAALVAIVVSVGAGLWAWRAIHTPYQGFAGEAVFVDIPRFTGSAAMARQLEEQGVIRAAWQLHAAHLLTGRAPLQAGEYRFTGTSTARQVVERLRLGDVYVVRLRIPEGLNLWELAQLIADSELKEASDFLEQARNPRLIRDLAPGAQSLEGYLFPSTYEFRRRATGREICERLTREFRQQWASLAASADVHQVVTLASLVEKESGVPAERPLVASVYTNRLREGMKLDCDPTVIYAALLEGRYRGTIYLSDLQRDHPYNTYLRQGLPPGPIASPGLASLQAALRPAESPYLFFVAKGDGSGEHRFSEDLSAHNRAVQAYRNAIKTPATNRGNSGNR